MRATHSIFFVAAALAVGCGLRKEGWDTNKQTSHVYLATQGVGTAEPTSDERIRDVELMLTNAHVVSVAELETNQLKNPVLAFSGGFSISLLTNSLEQAAIPENRGKMLPVIVNRKWRVHFLSREQDGWYSTNVLKTRVVSVVCSVTPTPPP